ERVEAREVPTPRAHRIALEIAARPERRHVDAPDRAGVAPAECGDAAREAHARARDHEHGRAAEVTGELVEEERRVGHVGRVAPRSRPGATTTRTRTVSGRGTWWGMYEEHLELTQPLICPSKKATSRAS